MTDGEVPNEVVVRALPSGSGKLGIVALGLPGPRAGDWVMIQSEQSRAFGRVVWQFGMEPLGEDEICIDEWQREDLAVGEGDMVAVRIIPRESAPLLTRVDLRLSGDLPPSMPPDELVRFMCRKQFPLYRGFRFELDPIGGGQTIVCKVRRIRSGSEEVPFGMCDAEAEVRLRSGAPVEEVSYDDIGGLDREVQRVRESVELPIRMHNAIDRLGISAPRGIIFYGPPGTGKTLLARALASKAGVPIFLINPSELLSLHPTQAEAELNGTFDEAERAATGSIVLVDELDAIAGKRDGTHTGSGLVTTLLTRIDGLKSRGNVVVIGTTNRIESIDDALRRHGRFSREIHIAAPDEAGRLQILLIHTRGMPFYDEDEQQRDQVLQSLSQRTHGYVGADLMELCREAGLNSLRRAHPIEALDRGDLEPRSPLVVTEADFEEATSVVQPSAMKEVMVAIPDVSFEDIRGLDSVIGEIRARVMGPLLHPEVFEQMGLSADRGVLLHGPPGTGKTMLAKAIAKECGANFITIQGPELLSKWFGESEEGVRRVFGRARQLAPAVLFFDEIEALLPGRGGHHDSGASDRVVNQFLAELDGIVDLKKVTVIGATNRPEMIDRAATRSGRLGTHLLVPLPSPAGRLSILRLYAPSFGDDVLRPIAEQTETLSGADLEAICREAKLRALREVNYERAVPVTATHLEESVREFFRRTVGRSVPPTLRGPASREESGPHPQAANENVTETPDEPSDATRNPADDVEHNAPLRATVDVDGTPFPLVNNVEAAMDMIESEGRFVLQFRGQEYGARLHELFQSVEERFGQSSNQHRDVIPSLLVCAGCLWEFPGSYKLALQDVSLFKGNVIGATPGYDDFGETGQCPQCGSDECLLVYECFDTQAVTQDDVQAIARFWRSAAESWWQNQESPTALCDACSATMRRPDGYVTSNRLRCETCIQSGLLSEGLERLRENPHHYGAALLRKSRRR